LYQTASSAPSASLMGGAGLLVVRLPLPQDDAKGPVSDPAQCCARDRGPVHVDADIAAVVEGDTDVERRAKGLVRENRLTGNRTVYVTSSPQVPGRFGRPDSVEAR